VATKRKPEGISSLMPTPESVSIQEITMLDWYAGFASLSSSTMSSPADSAKETFDRAEALMAEREKRMK
jgi:hypothetical protein